MRCTKYFRRDDYLYKSVAISIWKLISVLYPHLNKDIRTLLRRICMGVKVTAMLWLLLTAHYPRDTSLSGLFSHTVPMHLAAVVVTKTKTPDAACQSNAKSPRTRPPEIIYRINPQIRYKTFYPSSCELLSLTTHGGASNGPPLAVQHMLAYFFSPPDDYLGSFDQ